MGTKHDVSCVFLFIVYIFLIKYGLVGVSMLNFSGVDERNQSVSMKDSETNANTSY